MIRELKNVFYIGDMIKSCVYLSSVLMGSKDP